MESVGEKSVPKLQYEIYEQGIGGPILLWGMYPFLENDRSHTIEEINRLCPGASYTLVSYQVQDWNGQFSPWKHDALPESFSGGGAATLRWILQELCPALELKYGRERKLYFMGYSLAGLFSLWAITQVADSGFSFGGAASCSGSLWYPGFLLYMEQYQWEQSYTIYLSLGGKEANTNNPLMATILEDTRKVTNILVPNHRVILEMNSGGHFADAGKRLAKAVKWILASEDSYNPSK